MIDFADIGVVVGTGTGAAMAAADITLAHGGISGKRDKSRPPASPGAAMPPAPEPVTGAGSR